MINLVLIFIIKMLAYNNQKDAIGHRVVALTLLLVVKCQNQSIITIAKVKTIIVLSIINTIVYLYQMFKNAHLSLTLIFAIITSHYKEFVSGMVRVVLQHNLVLNSSIMALVIVLGNIVRIHGINHINKNFALQINAVIKQPNHNVLKEYKHLDLIYKILLVVIGILQLIFAKNMYLLK